ncbi:hypothetical protein GCM10007916_01500 [Psychromonas marina]|uniref:Transcriptional regulator VspR n=1 Tax=Psychromonas marina TaxID=88364 RepID=A0ABQ6DVG4_9GAMM|nr:hypothetical protein [Psychromonas marina]GLS89083.1 hypothetical protein GCM10007916_01500 [Psychromonas marina]
MSNKVDMNVFLHSLLVIKQMNDFTVAEARDALLREHAEFTDEVETRKFIYRQLSRNIEKGLIKRTDCFDSGSKQVIYSKTDKLLASSVVPIKRGSKAPKVTHKKEAVKVPETARYRTELHKELMAYEMDLNTTLEEAKEYKRLSARFPDLKDKLQQHQSQAKDKSIKLLGKIHALQNLLGYTVTGHQTC